jgi:hypothetical protein
LGRSPTRQVVTGDEPYPTRELEAIAARSKPWLSSPAVPPTCPKHRSTTVANGHTEVPNLRHRQMAGSPTVPPKARGVRAWAAVGPRSGC